MSARIRRLRRITESIRPEVEAAIERAVGSSFFLSSPTPARLAAWRARANKLSAREAGYAYAAYGQLKIATVVEEVAATIFRLGGGGDTARRTAVRDAVWNHIRAVGLTDREAVTAKGARDDVVAFLIDFDLTFRTRRLRFVARRSPRPPGRWRRRARSRKRCCASSTPRSPAIAPASPMRRRSRRRALPPAPPGIGRGGGGARRNARPPRAGRRDRRGASQARLIAQGGPRALISLIGYPYYASHSCPCSRARAGRIRPIRSTASRPTTRSRSARAGRTPREGPAVQQLRRLLQPRLSRERLSVGPPPRRRPPDRHRQFGGLAEEKRLSPDAIAALSETPSAPSRRGRKAADQIDSLFQEWSRRSDEPTRQPDESQDHEHRLRETARPCSWIPDQVRDDVCVPPPGRAHWTPRPISTKERRCSS